MNISIGSFIIQLVIYSTLSVSFSDLRQHIIDLDRPAELRYTQLANTHKQSINEFIDQLDNYPVYHSAFKYALLLSIYLPNLLGTQFYGQCLSVASGIDRPVSQVVVLNYIYELGAFGNFCTTVPVQSDSGAFMVRNFDYSFHQYFCKLTVKLSYFKNQAALFQTVSHAGIVGTHTGYRVNGYSITLNARDQGTLNQNIANFLFKAAHNSMYMLIDILSQCQTMEQAVEYITRTRNCAPAYVIMNDRQGNVVIEKQREGVNKIYRNQEYFVQTNTDREKRDPDGRKRQAQKGMERLLRAGTGLDKDNVWEVVTRKPVKNYSTLMTVLIDVGANQIEAKLWNQLWGN